MADDFYPCNERERLILAELEPESLEVYISRRHAGDTVTEALAFARSAAQHDAPGATDAPNSKSKPPAPPANVPK